MVCSSTLNAMGGFHIVGLLQVEGLQPTSAYQITDMLLLSTISEPPLKQLISVLAGLGVRKGDRVATLLMNGPEFVETFFGGAKIGAVIAPLNWRLVADELAFILADSG